MADARLILFGPPRLEVPAGRAPLTSRKGLALLAYLALTARRQARDALAELLWPDRSREDALANLRRTLYRVRAALPPAALEITADSLTLAGPGLWVDAWELRDALRTLPPDGDPSPTALPGLHAAVSLCDRTLLEGLELAGCPAFEAWLSLERDAHGHALGRALAWLGEASLLAGDAAAALDAGRRWTASLPFSEAGHRLIMRAHAALGDTTAALEQYRRCREILERELGAAPDAATERLQRALRTGTPLPRETRTHAPSEVRFVRSGEVHIAYQVIGRGAPDLIVAPGFVSHLDHLWRHPPLRAALARLAERFRLILFDRRGVGLSERIGAAPTLYATARDIDAVLRAVGSSGAFVFGFSEGGPAALLYAALHPERVRGLMLYGTMAKGLREADYPWAPDARQFDAWLEVLVSRWGMPVPHEAFAPSYREDASLWRWYAELMRLGSSPAGTRTVLDAVRRLDARSVLPCVAAPALVLHRRGDRVIRVGHGRYLAEHLPAARYLELDGEDHWWWLGDADAVLDAVERFVAEVAGAPSPAGGQRTVLCILSRQGTTDARVLPEPLAALEAAAGTAAPDRRAERAVVHCDRPGSDPEALALRLLEAARPGELLVTGRVRAIARSVGYAFERRRTEAIGAAVGTAGVWSMTRRPA